MVRLTLGLIKMILTRVGTIESLVIIPKDFKGELSSFVVFKEPGACRGLYGSRLELIKGKFISFERPLSQEELKEFNEKKAEKNLKLKNQQLGALDNTIRFNLSPRSNFQSLQDARFCVSRNTLACFGEDKSLLD